jgi:hypothetical protein
MRAILFASATVTSRTGRHWRTPLVQMPAALFHCGARKTIAVAPNTSSLRISRLPVQSFYWNKLYIRPQRGGRGKVPPHQRHHSPCPS